VGNDVAQQRGKRFCLTNEDNDVVQQTWATMLFNKHGKRFCSTNRGSNVI
jgi:hypothetical protein